MMKKWTAREVIRWPLMRNTSAWRHKDRLLVTIYTSSGTKRQRDQRHLMGMAEEQVLIQAVLIKMLICRLIKTKSKRKCLKWTRLINIISTWRRRKRVVQDHYPVASNRK
jgi:hypothetical protein